MKKVIVIMIILSIMMVSCKKSETEEYVISSTSTNSKGCPFGLLRGVGTMRHKYYGTVPVVVHEETGNLYISSGTAYCPLYNKNGDIANIREYDWLNDTERN